MTTTDRDHVHTEQTDVLRIASPVTDSGAGLVDAGAENHDHGPHTQTRAVLNRLARIQGHVRAVHGMVESGRPCADVLLQLAAVRSAVDRVARVVLEDHVENCLRQAVATGSPAEEWRSLKEALDRFIS